MAAASNLDHLSLCVLVGVDEHSCQYKVLENWNSGSALFLFFTYKLMKFMSLENSHGLKEFCKPSHIKCGEMLFQKN